MNYIISKKNRKIEAYIKEINKELSDFFKFKVICPTVIFFTSRDQLDLVWGKKTPDWLVGGTRNINGDKNSIIFMLGPEIFAEQSSHKKTGEFFQVLKHEYSHVFYRQIVGSSYPLWLNEGLANYLAGQKKQGGDPLDAFKYFNYSDSNIYPVGFSLVNFLIKNFSKEKIVELIHFLGTEEKISQSSFSKIFENIYGFKFNRRELAIVLDSR